MRMIDADAVLDRYYAEFEKQDICDGSQDRDWLMRCIEEAPTITPPNEPLTIAQLREMDGEPVYWPKEKMWLIVYLNHPDFGDCALNREGQYLPLDKCERRKVYRRPPEGEE